jgi:hypothetical protein
MSGFVFGILHHSKNPQVVKTADNMCFGGIALMLAFWCAVYIGKNKSIKYAEEIEAMQKKYGIAPQIYEDPIMTELKSNLAQTKTAIRFVGGEVLALTFRDRRLLAR